MFSFASAYTQFTATVTYTSSATPDTLVVVLLPSNPVTPQTNSFVIFDDLGKNLTLPILCWADEAQMIQDTFYAKGQHEAAMVVPDYMADEISLCGPADRIKEKLQDWKKSKVTTLMIGVSPFGNEATRANMRILAEGM